MAAIFYRLKGDKNFSSEDYKEVVDYAVKKFDLSISEKRDLYWTGVIDKTEIVAFKKIKSTQQK